MEREGLVEVEGEPLEVVVFVAVVVVFMVSLASLSRGAHRR